MRRVSRIDGVATRYLKASNNLYSRPRTEIKAIKAAISPVEFYQRELLRMPCTSTSGWCDGGLCPFHLDRNIGNFRVHLITGAFYCFSCGESGGDIVAFTMQRDGLDFQDALIQLADHWGV